MTKNEITETLLALEVPAVRHLAWLCLSPQLLKHELSFDPAAHLPPEFLETLKRWERNPEALPVRLAETPERRLGHYFERLYEVLLRDLLGWDIVLQNQQVQAEGGRWVSWIFWFAIGTPANWSITKLPSSSI